MDSHHFIGVGLLSQALKEGAANPESIANHISQMVVDRGLGIVSQKTVNFDNAGVTLVWVLAESHLVVHIWTEEGFATIDLHVCDYRASNLKRAQQLKVALDEFCFGSEESKWHEFSLPQPVCAAY